MNIEMTIQNLSTKEFMIPFALAMAMFWTIAMEASIKYMRDAMPKTTWWKRAIVPTSRMMINFGFKSNVTEPEVRGFFAFLTCMCIEHIVSVVPMLPVAIFGWNKVSELCRCLFLLGTLSDVGVHIYDFIKSTKRTFFKDEAPLPLAYWIIVIVIHHSLALSMVIPMNFKYIHLPEYQQTVVSILLGGAACYATGNYKFTLDITKFSGMLQYKAIVIGQLWIILYTRAYLWFPTCVSMINHFKTEDDIAYAYGGAIMACIFSLFNVVCVVDAIQAAMKWLPKKMPVPITNKSDHPEHAGTMMRESTRKIGSKKGFCSSLTKRGPMDLCNY